MNSQLSDRIVLQVPAWLSFTVLLTCFSLLSPINVHIVIAQESNRDLTVERIEQGLPPSPEPRTRVNENITADKTSTVEKAFENFAPEMATRKELSVVASDTTLGEVELTSPVAEPVRNLSVEPGLRPLLPEDRPAWVGASPDTSSDQHYLYVGSIPTFSEGEADSALDEPLVAAVRNYIDDDVLQQFGASQGLPVDAAFIRKNLIDTPEGYMAELSTSEGPMYQKWVTVRITPEQRVLFHNWHKQATQRERLGPLGAVLLLLITGVAVSHLVLHRWHGGVKLPAVVQSTAIESLVTRKSSRSLTWLWVMLFCILVLPLLMVLGLMSVRSTRGQVTRYRGMGTDSYEMRNTYPPLPTGSIVFPTEIRVKSSDGSRAIIIQGQNRK